MAPRIRKNVWTLPSSDKTLEWYEKAVGVLQQRPIADPTSWWSLGAIHGYDPTVWGAFGYVTAATPLPPAAVQDQLWKQCQHQSWYFLPWHRGYLTAFEAIIRSVIKPLGGPDDWALPYWDYSDNKDWLELPRAFANATLPGGAMNHLFVKRRYGAVQVPNTQRPIKLDPRVVVTQRAMDEHFYTGSDDAAPGFGGLRTPFSHGDGGGTFGVLESQPHGGVHVFVGGGFKGSRTSDDFHDLGLMTMPDTAALDPIFWLHHANIDRLWNAWLKQHAAPHTQPDEFQNPEEADWLDGPRDRVFAMPKPDGTIATYTPRDVIDTRAAALNYIYDTDHVEAFGEDRLALRFERLGAGADLAKQWSGALKMAPPKPTELVGTNAGTVRLDSDVVESHIKLDDAVHRKVTTSLDMLTFNAVAPKAPDRVYLKLENIKSPSDAAAFYVYINLPPDADPKAHPELFAGTVSLFGARQASAPDGPTGGNGLSASLNITDIVDRLHSDKVFTGELSVKLVSAVPGATGEDISIGRISVHRQGQ